MSGLPTKRKGIAEQRIGDELYLYGTDGETLTVLNTTAMLIWSLCDGEHAIHDMTLVLLDIYGGSEDELRRDIRQCIQDFRSKNLVIPEDTAAG